MTFARNVWSIYSAEPLVHRQRSGHPELTLGTWVFADCSRKKKAGSWQRTRRVAPLLLARRLGRLGEQLHRIQELAVHQDLVVQVRSGRSSRGPDISDDVDAVNGLAVLYVESAEMTVPGRDAEVVAQDNEVAVLAFVLRGVDAAISR